MNLQDIEAGANARFLSIYGAFHPTVGDMPEDVKTLVLLGPLEPGFWPHFTASPEYQDRQPEPLDRWSSRVIGEFSAALNVRAYFPFGGPPYQPFIRWARESGRAHVSPVGLLVHDLAGLWVSYRGALGIPARLELPENPANPCSSCAGQPCRTACPVDALKPDAYDIAACKADLDRPANACMAKGCAARRACPVSQRFGRVEAQSAFHMEAFR